MSDLAGSGCESLVPQGERKTLEEIEKSIKKKFRKPLWSMFTKAIREYQLLQPGDKVAVAISGGKDSLLMAKLFQELQRQRQVELELEFIAMDPGYHPNIKELLIENCEHLQIPLNLFSADIFKVAQKIAGDYPCYMCAKMRRGALYSKAQELGCNKLALGHHYDDVIETTMLNLLCAGSFKNMLPKLKAKNFANMELIRPLYFIKEETITRFTNYCGIWPLNCACMVAAKKIGNKRYEVKSMIAEMKNNFQEVEKSIFRAGHNVYLDSILGWKKDGLSHSFLDNYDDE